MAEGQVGWTRGEEILRLVKCEGEIRERRLYVGDNKGKRNKKSE